MPPTVALAVAVGVLWWWAVLRLALAPAEAGPVEAAVAAGGWGLGLLPVHCTPWRAAGGSHGEGRGVTGVRGVTRARGVTEVRRVTRASRLPRSGEGSAPS
ncbi:hypothetical protein [Streptomyces sp. RerS4]|uniref:hypothetical protein n=1 Tax=Streptomyces sp. RerS4 TaxID=2942449 RepID=UPI00201BAE48|nr:hypothetical protein [Streptomyces sp. RerS4]UQX05175.1 hypothetical protein M4D82_24515 [Streptomyces sp. RerS4]